MDKEKKVNFVPMDYQACGAYRIKNPGMAMYDRCKVTVSPPGHLHYYGQDWIYTQRLCSAKVLEQVAELKKNGLRLAVDFDDCVWEELPTYNRCPVTWEKNREGMKEWLARAADVVTCTNSVLKDSLSQFVPEDRIRVIPNALDYTRWRFDRYAPPKETSFLYAGSPTHWSGSEYGDFPGGLVEYLKDKEVKVMGICPWFLKADTVSGWVQIDRYPTEFARAALPCRFVLAPLRDNFFSRCKSDLKYIECCAVGRVCLCSDISTYSLAHPYQVIPQDVTRWEMEKIVKRANEHYGEIIDHQYRILGERWLDTRPYEDIFG